jgi:hypothetical protein
MPTCQQTMTPPKFFGTSHNAPDHGPKTPILEGKVPISQQPVVRLDCWLHHSMGIFIASPTIPYSAAYHVSPTLFIHHTVLRAGGTHQPKSMVMIKYVGCCSLDTIANGIILWGFMLCIH